MRSRRSLARHFLLAAATWLLSPGARAAAESVPIADYVITMWNAKDGLPSDVVFSVTQDREGYLWLGTNGGLVRFDGVRFVTLEAVGGTPLPKSPVRTVYAGRDGSVWVGFSETGGISRLLEGTVRTYGEPDGFPRAQVTAIVEDRDGTIWAGTLRGLYKLAGVMWQPVGTSTGLPEVKVDSLYVDKAGNLLVGTAAGVYRQVRGTNTFDLVDALNDVGPTFREFGEDAAGRLWMTDPQVGFRLLGERAPAYRAAERGRGNRLLFDRERNLWVATMGEGLWRIRHEGLGRREAIEKTRVSGARTIFEDREGNIWAGAGDGLVCLRKPRVTPVTNLGPIEAVEATADGRVWAATADELLTFTHASRGARRVLAGKRIRAMRADRHGTLWVATDAGLLRLSDEERWYRPANGSSILNRISAIEPDGRGGLWIANREGGVLRWNPRQPKVFEPVPALANVRMSLIYGDRQGRLWFAPALGGIGMLEHDGAERLFGPQDGLSSRNYLAMYEDSCGVMWIGGFDGLHRLVGNRFVPFNQANRFRGAVVGIAEDGDSDVWLATASGIVCVTRSALDASLAKPGAAVGMSLFDLADGTAGMPISFGGPSVVRATDGRLWFLTGRGLTSLEPGLLEQPRAPARVKIEGVQVDEQSLAALPQAQLAARTTRIQIDFTALDSTTPLRTQFKYRLEGFDAEWIDAGSRRQALYTHLPPRDYRFHVVASTSDGSWSDASAVWNFSIRPHFRQTYWFATLCVLAAALGTWMVWQLHVRRIRRQFALLLGERVRLSRELHDTLLQSLVGVALQFDAVSNSLDPMSPARQQLVRMRKLVEEHIREARASIWSLRAPRLGAGNLAAALRESAERTTAGLPVGLEFTQHGTTQLSSARTGEVTFGSKPHPSSATRNTIASSS